MRRLRLEISNVTAFKMALVKYKIRQILGRVHHPQQVGKPSNTLLA